MNKKIIFLDWDGTICWSRFWESLIKSDVVFAQAVNKFFLYEKEIVHNWMRGKIKSEQINVIISRKTGLSRAKVWREFVSNCEKMKIDKDIISLVKKVRKKHPVILVTGNMDCFTRFTVPALKLNEIFDDIVNSADIGYLKTDYDGRVFIDLLEKFDIDNISNAYLLDDSEKTCKIFNQLGGTAIKINSKKDTINHLKIFCNKN